MCALRRQVYLTTLESTRSATLAFAQRVAPNEATAAGLSNFCAGAFASLVTQSVIVPVDVVSQKLMVAGPAAQPATAVKSADGFPLPEGHHIGMFIPSVLRQRCHSCLWRSLLTAAVGVHDRAGRSHPQVWCAPFQL